MYRIFTDLCQSYSEKHLSWLKYEIFTIYAFIRPCEQSFSHFFFFYFFIEFCFWFNSNFEQNFWVFFFFWFYAFDRHNHGSCMLDKPRHDMITVEEQLAGEKFSANDQCELVFGPGSKVCSYMVSCFKNRPGPWEFSTDFWRFELKSMRYISFEEDRRKKKNLMQPIWKSNTPEYMWIDISSEMLQLYKISVKDLTRSSPISYIPPDPFVLFSSVTQFRFISTW